MHHSMIACKVYIRKVASWDRGEPSLPPAALDLRGWCLLQGAQGLVYNAQYALKALESLCLPLERASEGQQRGIHGSGDWTAHRGGGRLTGTDGTWGMPLPMFGKGNSTWLKYLLCNLPAARH